NPIPGRFSHSMYHDYVIEYSYTVPLGDFEPGDSMVIAAHAVVKKAVDGCYEPEWMIGEKEQSKVYPEGTPNAGQKLLTNYADEFNWPNATPFTAGDSLAVSQPAYDDPFVVGTSQVSDFPYNSNFARGYATDFDVVWDGALPFGGLLTISWSPGQSAAEQKVVSDTGATLATVNRTGTPTPGEGFFLDTYPVYEEDPIAVGPYAAGTQSLTFMHTEGDGTFWDWILLERPCEMEETAWAGTSQGETAFPGANWATYFTYTVMATLGCPHVVLTDSTPNIDVLATPPSSVEGKALESNDLVRVFLESGPMWVGDLQLTDPDVTISANVCSYYVHADHEVWGAVYEGTIAFDGPVVGLIGHEGDLNDSHAVLGAPGTTYETYSLYGIESPDTVTVVDGDSVDFRLSVEGYVDAFRVILEPIETAP
ncbi:MAG: hypothetical protein R3324_03615, partial [Halobacteriales archaeon]|nr:hypothetical protein [Halobacteriales archaeon]